MEGVGTKTSPSPPATGKGPNSVIIVGETISLIDDIPEKAMGNMQVNFKDYYVPGDMTNTDKEKLREALRRVFTKKDEPPPPCNASDKDIIIKSLEFRLGKLREKRNTAPKKDSANDRNTIRHIEKLCAFLDKFMTVPCNDQGIEYNESGLGELTDTTVDTLLKQFIFVMLQAHLPIEDYKQFTQEAKNIIRKVNKMPSDLDEIVRKFEGKIPNRIKELINCMKLVPLKVIEEMVQNEIKILVGKIIDKAKAVIDKDDPFWKVIGSQPTIEGVVDALLTKINELKNTY